MAKSLCRLLIKENHALVANFNVSNMSFNALPEFKILAEIVKCTTAMPIIQQNILTVVMLHIVIAIEWSY